MSKALWIHSSSRHALQTIVPNRRRRFQTFIDVSGFEYVALLSGMPPHPGKAIGLQLQTDGKLIRRSRIPPARSLNFLFNPKYLLHVMSDFMGQNISLGEIARGAEALFQFVIKAQIDVDLFVLRTIKRPACRLCHATG